MSAKADIKQKIAKVLVVIPVILVIIIVIATLITIRGIDKDEGILYDVYYHAQFVSLFGMGLAPYPCILMSSVAIILAEMSNTSGNAGSRRLFAIALVETIIFALIIILFLVLSIVGAGV